MLAAALYGVWALNAAAPDAPSQFAAAPPAAPATLPAAESAPAVEVPAAAAEPAADLPPGVTREQWAAIEAEVRQRPDAPAELQRLRAYLHWSDTLRRFREAPAAGVSPAERAALAQTLEQGLGERIRNAEVSAGEARQIESAILALTVTDDAERAERLRQWAEAELAPAPAPDPRQAEFERRQVEIVAAWSAQPAGARDAAALERDLEALRRQSFTPSPAGTR